MYIDALKVSSHGPTITLKRNPCDTYINPCYLDILHLWGGNVDLQHDTDEIAMIMYVCSNITKSKKATGETLKRVAQECRNDDVWTQMNKIKNEFLGKLVLAIPESCIHVISMWLMKKAGKFKMLIQICRMNMLVCQSEEHNWHKWRMMMTMCLQQV